MLLLGEWLKKAGNLGMKLIEQIEISDDDKIWNDLNVQCFNR